VRLKMINYYDGTIFNVDAHALVNTVNCIGVMGAGIALEFMLRYPDMYDDYVAKCKGNIIKTGAVDYFKRNDGLVIVNFPTKWHFKYPSRMIWIEQGLQNFAETYRDQKIKSVAFPKLGTQKGGLNWNIVKEQMERYLKPLDIKVIICLDALPEAEGAERIMVDTFNLSTIEEISGVVKLTKKQMSRLENAKPLKRFWHIYSTDTIGIRTYSNLFRYYYDIAIGVKTKIKQYSLDDYLPT
jgi:O-acetyl-ADP-ribose deacetylase (regulator of RNase III)